MILRPVAPAGAAVQTVAAQTIDFAERRAARRKNVATNALIFSDDIGTSIPCMVRDISMTGARLELPVSLENPLGGRARLPGTFMLKLRLDRMEAGCAIAWRNGAFVGVRFLSTPRSYARSGK